MFFAFCDERERGNVFLTDDEIVRDTDVLYSEKYSET